jgi:tetratricopeptide (TPR) repeat protein
MLNPECQIPRSRVLSFTVILLLGLFLNGCGHSTAKFIAKGEEYLQKRKFHDALMQFRSAVESDSDSAKAHWGLARAYENLGQFNETLEELRKAVELDGTNLEAKTKLGNYFLLVQPPMIAETEKIRDEVLAADPAYIEGHILSAAILAAQGRPDEQIINAVNKAIDLNPQRIESYINLERLYTTRQRPVDAEATLKRGLQANPDAIPGYIEYGKFLTYANQNADAEAQFHRAVDIDPKGIAANEALAEFYVATRRNDLAENAYKDLVQIQENSPESRIELAEFYSNTDRRDEAISSLNAILAETPEYAMARYRLGQILLDEKNFAGVNEQLDALFAVNDEDTEALLLRARLNIQQDKPEAAVEDLQTVIKQFPSNKDALYLMGQSRLALGQLDQAKSVITDLQRYHPTYLRVGLLKIQAAFAANDPQNAWNLADELIAGLNAARPDAETDAQGTADIRMRALTSRGLANLALNNFGDARLDLQAVVDVSPRSSAALVNLAKAYSAGKNFSESLSIYQRAMAADGQNFDAISGYVSTSIRLGQSNKAHAKLDELMIANADTKSVLAGLHYLNSNLYTAEKNAVAAEQELHTALELDPKYLPAYSAYAAILVAQNRTDEAIAQYQKVAEKTPAAQVFTLLGILHDSQGKTSEAEADYRRALQISPDSAIAANNLAWLIADSQGNLDEALQLANSAVSKDQSVAGFYDTLGWVYMKKGLYSPAVQQLRKAVALDDAAAERSGTAATPGYRVRLGMALAKAGDRSSARREAETSMRHSGLLSQREADDVKNLLATL